MGYLLAFLLAYALGCSSMALYLSKLKHVDFRAGGSGNLGASNATILMGWKAGVLVGVHDIGKAALAVFLAKVFFPALPHVGVTVMATLFTTSMAVATVLPSATAEKR